MVVASRSQAWKTEALGDETWKEIMRHAVPFLNNSLRKLCMAEHDGCTRTCFEKEAGAEKMSEEIFLRHSLQDREWKSGKKLFGG